MPPTPIHRHHKKTHPRPQSPLRSHRTRAHAARAGPGIVLGVRGWVGDWGRGERGRDASTCAAPSRPLHKHAVVGRPRAKLTGARPVITPSITVGAASDACWRTYAWMGERMGQSTGMAHSLDDGRRRGSRSGGRWIHRPNRPPQRTRPLLPSPSRSDTFPTASPATPLNPCIHPSIDTNKSYHS